MSTAELDTAAELVTRACLAEMDPWDYLAFV